MTYRQEMGRLSRELGKLLLEGGRVPGVDLPAAVAGHASVVRLLRAVHDELVPPEWIGVTDLGHVLFDQPNATDRPLRPGPSAPAASRAGERWGNVAEWATAAQHEWHQSTLTSRPTGRAAWSEVADLASLAETIGLLDADIADSLAEAGRWHDAQNFRNSQPKLLATAQNVRTLVAEAGPLPTAPDLKPATTGEVLLIPTPEALPQALDRLSVLITSAADLPPAQVELISGVVAETAIASATALHRNGDPASTALREHAHRLSAVTGFSPHLVPLRMGSGKAAAQAQRVHQLLRNLHLRGTTLSPQIARDAARTLTSITTALTNSVEKQVKAGLWLISGEGTGALHRAVSNPSNDQSRMLDTLRHANKHGGTLSRAVNRAAKDATPKRRHSPVPRKVLAGPLSQRGSPVSPVRSPGASPRQR